MRCLSTRVTFAIFASCLGALGCVAPKASLGLRGSTPRPGQHGDSKPAVASRASVSLHGPPAPRLGAQRWLPRGELYWDRTVRYRFLAQPTLTLNEGFPTVSRGEEPLIDGRLGLKLNIDAAGFVERSGIEHVHDDVEVRRAYLTSSGTVHLLHPLQYNLEFGVLGRDFYLDSAWLMVRSVPWVGSIKLGGLDAPIGFDNLVSSRDRTFMETAAPVQAFVPATSLGLLARRTHHDGRGSVALGWFTVGQRRDVGDQSRALARVVGRTTWLLREDTSPREDEAAELVHIGVAGAYTFSGADSVRYQARPESFLAPVVVDTGAIDANSAFVLGLEVAARRGSLSFQGG